MFTLEEFQDSVTALRAGYEEHLPLSFVEDISSPWFEGIFPVKNETYGVEGLQRLGPNACVAEFVGCYYRWERMSSHDFSITNESMKNSLIDAFGYSVLMRALAGVQIQWGTVARSRAPKKDLDILLGLHWDDFQPVDVAACTIATRCSLNMYRRTPGA